MKAPEAEFVVTQGNSNIQQQQMSFNDENAGEEVKFASSSIHEYDTAATSGMDLGNFCERPVLIDTFTWTEGGFAAHTFNPWTLYFTHPTIKKKIDNFGLWRGNLKVKVIISASPFYYGASLVSYNPTPWSHSGPSVVIGSDLQMVTYSQRPSFWMLPATSQGGEMTLPFFYDLNWCETTLGSIEDMGEIRYDSPFVLLNANSTAGATVTINCYAWMDDLELSAPTAYELQGKRTKRATLKRQTASSAPIMNKITTFGGNSDEYGDGPVSGIASAVANAGSALSNIPVIGPFARATEIGAGALSRVASWFGYTNVPVISDVQPYKDLPFGGFASSELSAPTPKLTLDPKNELTLDSRTVGLDGADELSFESIVTRESYLEFFEWDTSDTPDTTLWTSSVSPSEMYRVDSNRIYMTPLAFALTTYQYWTGDVIFRFRVIATKFHRGRFRISFEPSQNASYNTPLSDQTVNITHIYDIGETMDVEICIPYMQAQAFLANSALSSSRVAFSDTSSSINSTGEHNGHIVVSVVNELTSPIADAPVKIIVSVRGAPNLKALGPIAPPQRVQWTSQALVMDSMGDCDAEEPQLFNVFGGETAYSLRQLLHRHCYNRAGISEAEQDYSATFSMYPLSLNTFNADKNIHQGGINKYNYIANSFVSWFSPMFAGRRGSMYWAANTNANSGEVSVTFYRNPGSMGTDGYDRTILSPTSTSATASYTNMLYQLITKCGNGAALVNTVTQSGATALVPFISARRFIGTYVSPYFNSLVLKRGVEDTVTSLLVHDLHETGDIIGVDYYCAAGPDFNLFFFTGIPTLSTVSLPLPV